MSATAILRAVPRNVHIPKLIRFPPELGEKLEAIAQRERRTFTAQMLLIVEQWLAEHGEPYKDLPPKRL